MIQVLVFALADHSILYSHSVPAPITGAIISSQGGSYQGAATFAGVMVFVGTGFVGASRVVLGRRRGTQWV